ncbi:hypothetical protein GQX74_004827 [Glossina fuscipes]|nr:hypothetical protein GQX74_004827 [Glossina fuscipes]
MRRKSLQKLLNLGDSKFALALTSLLFFEDHLQLLSSSFSLSSSSDWLRSLSSQANTKAIMVKVFPKPMSSAKIPPLVKAFWFSIVAMPCVVASLAFLLFISFDSTLQSGTVLKLSFRCPCNVNERGLASGLSSTTMEAKHLLLIAISSPKFLICRSNRLPSSEPYLLFPFPLRCNLMLDPGFCLTSFLVQEISG